MKLLIFVIFSISVSSCVDASKSYEGKGELKGLKHEVAHDVHWVEKGNKNVKSHTPSQSQPSAADVTNRE